MLFMNNDLTLVSIEPPGIIREHKRVTDVSWRVFDEYWIIDEKGM